MSQLSPQDMQSLQQLIGVITPKIIERLKTCETEIRDMRGILGEFQKCQRDVEDVHKLIGNLANKIDQLQTRLGAMEQGQAAPPPQATVKRRGKKKELEVPQLVTEEADDAAPLVASVPDPVTDPGVSTVAAAPVAGNVPSSLPVIDGTQVTDQLIFGAQYVMSQGFLDPAVVAQALQTSPAVVEFIQSMTEEERKFFEEQFRQVMAAAQQ